MVISQRSQTSITPASLRTEHSTTVLSPGGSNEPQLYCHVQWRLVDVRTIQYPARPSRTDFEQWPKLLRLLGCRELSSGCLPRPAHCTSVPSGVGSRLLSAPACRRSW